VARRFLLIAIVVIAACGKGDGKAPRGDKAAAPVDPMGMRGAVIRSCLSAFVEIADQLPDTPPAPDLTARVVCADLYRADCADAWRRLARDPTTVADVLPACARTYCPELAPAPEACRAGARGDDMDLLAKLDVAIHVHEGSSPDEASAMAKRIKLFAPITVSRDAVDIRIGGAVPIDTPAPPGQPTWIPHPALRIALGKDSLELDGDPTTLAEIEARVRSQVASDPESRFIVASDGDVPHGRVVEAMEAIKNGGGKSIAIEIVPP
jgi:hypothetical protein